MLNERGEEVHETCINGFPENIILWGNCTLFGRKAMYAHNNGWIHSKEFFKSLHNQRSQKLHQNHINGFSEKNSFRAIVSFWSKNGMLS